MLLNDTSVVQESSFRGKVRTQAVENWVSHMFAHVWTLSTAVMLEDGKEGN